jgi:hypothetical protein
MPDVLLVAGNRWDALVGMVDADGRPVYDLSAGIAGLEVVYSPQAANDFIAVGASRFLECWEAVKGTAPAPITAPDVGVAYLTDNCKGDYLSLTGSQGHLVRALSGRGGSSFFLH